MQHWQAEKWPLLSVDKPATHKAADLAPPCVDNTVGLPLCSVKKVLAYGPWNVIGVA